MPGYEIIDNKEFKEVSEVFKKVKFYSEWVLINNEKAFTKFEILKKNFPKIKI